jgi:AraC-like DNA-binding protein
MSLSPDIYKLHTSEARIMDWSALGVKLLWAYEGHPDTGGCEGSYVTEHSKAWLFRRGYVDIEEKNKSWHAEAGQWLLGGPGMDKRRFSDDAEIVSLSFHAAWPTGESLFQDEPVHIFEASRYPELEKAAMALCSFVNEWFPQAWIALPSHTANVHSFMKLNIRIMDWMDAFITAMTEDGAVPRRLGVVDQRVLRVLSLLDSWPLETPMERKRLAAACGLTIQHLDRIFSKHLGITPSVYFEKRRLEKARWSLCKSSASIKEISYGIGFSSAAHFSHWFKLRHKLSPQQFRQQYQASR